MGRESNYFYPAPNQKAYNLDVAASINSLGLRNKEIDPDTSLSRRRILAVGDSHTFGYGIIEENSWPRQLERMLNLSNTNEDGAYEVINAGVPALSLSQEVEFFRERLSSLYPNWLILAYYWNDMPIIGLPEALLADEENLERSSSCSTLKNNTHQNKSAERNNFLAEMKHWMTSWFRKSYLLYFIVQRLPFLQMAFFPTTETK